MYLRRQKMYLVNNVLENRIRAVPLLEYVKFRMYHFWYCQCNVLTFKGS